ncbi:MAG TPA: polyphosphate:AMP phosphotransferase [Candidatus Hydrogenedens sp.]|nr:polyphosphate:AMP phosphotransferase [Candidatus Hydrogenedens sp.]
MLDIVNLDSQLSKRQFNEQTQPWTFIFGNYQRELRQKGIPTIVLIEGWETSGKGTLLNYILLNLDPRGYWVHNITKPTREEKLHPYLWRFWNKLPPYGDIAFFNHSWYWHIILKAQKKKWSVKKICSELQELKTFERQIIEDGTILIKLFLHISQKEQEKRFKKLEKDPAFKWRTQGESKELLKLYSELYKITDVVLEETNTYIAPWYIIPATDKQFCILEAGSILLSHWDNVVKNGLKTTKYTLAPRSKEPLKEVDLSKTISREQYEKLLPKYQKELKRLQFLCFKERVPVVIMFEGWDAAGKGGAIKRLVRELDPRGYEVIPIGAPQGEEKRHQHLWRFWKALPRAGHFTIYDRSWYGRVLVERIEGFAKPEEWKRAYSEINEFELQLVKWGAIMIKFWLHISPEEQLRRFEERQSNPYKQWKITEEDWRNRAKWKEYEEAVSDMIDRTSTLYAPWTIVEGNDKYFARIKVLESVINCINEKINNK